MIWILALAAAMIGDQLADLNQTPQKGAVFIVDWAF